MDCKQLRCLGFFSPFSPPTPSSQIWTNIVWFFNVYANKSQQAISWSVLTEFVWSCAAAHPESRGIRQKITLAPCSRNAKGLGSLRRGWKLQCGIRSKQKALQARLSKLRRELEEPLTFRASRRRFSTSDFFPGEEEKFAGTAIPLEFISAWLNSGLVVSKWMVYQDNYLISWENFPLVSFSLAWSCSFFCFLIAGKSGSSMCVLSTAALRFVTDKSAVVLDAWLFCWWTLWYRAQEVVALPRCLALKAAAFWELPVLWGFLHFSRSLAAGYWTGSIWLRFGTLFFCF